MAAAAWWRAWRASWRSRNTRTVHGGANANTNTRDDGACPPAGAAGGSRSITSSGTTTYTTTTGSRSTPGSGAISDPLIFLQPPVVVVDHHELGKEEERVRRKLKHMEGLVVRFTTSDKSAAPETWLSELNVSWVLHLANANLRILGNGKIVDANVNEPELFWSGQLLKLARSWILALFEITGSISTCFDRGLFSKEGEPPASEFLRFFQATLSKMLPFVDAAMTVAVRESAAATARMSTICRCWSENLQALIVLRDALSTASTQIMSSCSGVQGRETTDLLFPVDIVVMLDEAIWNAIKGTQASLMSSSSWGVMVITTPDIHPITRSLISYIKVLWDNYVTANLILHGIFLRGEAQSMPPVNENNGCHVASLTKEMIHSLEQKLITSCSTRSNSTTTPWNRSLELLFLINNFHFIHQQKQLWPLAFPTPDLALAAKIYSYVESYIQVAWAPVLQCLHNPMPHRRCFSGNSSSLPKFGSCFRNTYDAHKHLKVPDPGTRTRMREAVIQELIPSFTITEFFKDTTTLGTARISPQEMENMLQELFEG